MSIFSCKFFFCVNEVVYLFFEFIRKAFSALSFIIHLYTFLRVTVIVLRLVLVLRYSDFGIVPPSLIFLTVWFVCLSLVLVESICWEPYQWYLLLKRKGCFNLSVYKYCISLSPCTRGPLYYICISVVVTSIVGVWPLESLWVVVLLHFYLTPYRCLSFIYLLVHLYTDLSFFNLYLLSSVYDYVCVRF